MRSTSSPRAVRRRTLSEEKVRRRVRTSKPSMPGSMTSRRIMGQGRERAASRPVSPRWMAVTRRS